MATRVIENRRDRLATILVAPLMSCSARLPVYILLIGAFLTDGYPLVDAGPGHVRHVPARPDRGSAGRSVAEADPAARRDAGVRHGDAVVQAAVDAGWSCGDVRQRRLAFLDRAGTIILASMVLVWALLYFPGTNAAGRAVYEK